MPFFGVPIRNGLPIGLGSVAGFGVQQFDPSQLFEGGTVAGAWYDPSDLTTLFTTSAGTTPVAMPGLGSAVSVGLMLDKSQGLVLGPELVTNGDFSSGTTGWTADRGGSLSVVSGSLRVTQGAVTDFALGYQAVTLVIGQWYKLTVDFVGGTATAVQVGVGTSFTSSDATFFSNATSPRTLTVYFAATATTMYVRGSVNVTTDNVYADFDNFSLKALPGNHAIAFNNTTARPELRARVNLLTYSEQFDNGVWTRFNLNAFGSGSVANTTATLDPLGGNTADYIQENTANNQHAVYNTTPLSLAATQHTASIYAKAAERNWLIVNLNTAGGDNRTWFDLSNGTVGTNAAGNTAQIVDVGNGWYKCSVTRTTATSNSYFQPQIADADGSFSYTGTGTSGIYIWGADLRPANIGANVPAYQRISDANTYDTNGFPLYLYFDGTDDSMYTPANLNLSGTDKATVFAGVRKLSDGARAALVELSSGLLAGSFMLEAPDAAAATRYAMRLRGDAASAIQVTTQSVFSAPITNVLTSTYDIAGATALTEMQMRANGVTLSLVDNSGGATAGGGNFGTYPLYIGSRANSSLWFNGHLHSLIIAGSAVSAGNISATEQWVAGKTGIQI